MATAEPLQVVRLSTGERIDLLMRRAGIKTVDLADALGLTEQTIRNYRKDRRPVPPETLFELAAALSTTAEYLAGKIEDPRRSHLALVEYFASK